MSVVIPLYNKAPHVARAVASVLAQSVHDFELVVVDDGSTDGGGDIVRQFRDPRIRLVRQQNGGAAAARNRGIHESRFDRIAFLDADDEWTPVFLETVLGLSARHPQAGIYATAYRCSMGQAIWRPSFTDCVDRPEGGILEDYFRTGLKSSPVTASSSMIPRRVFEDVGGFLVGVARGEDLQMWIRIALRYRVAWSPVEGAIYHLDADNRACATPEETTTDLAIGPSLEELLRSGPEPIVPRTSVQEYLVGLRLAEALDSHLAGQHARAVGLVEKTKGTRVFRRRRWLAMCALRVPPPVLSLMLNARAVLRFGEEANGPSFGQRKRYDELRHWAATWGRNTRSDQQGEGRNR